MAMFKEKKAQVQESMGQGEVREEQGEVWQLIHNSY